MNNITPNLQQTAPPPFPPTTSAAPAPTKVKLEEPFQSGSTGVSLDDYEAVAKLKTALAEREAKQVFMRKVNAALRKGDGPSLRALGVSETMEAELRIPDFCGRTGYPDIRLRNNLVSIRRLRKRIVALAVRDQFVAATDREVYGITIRESAADNRLMLLFPEMPPTAVRIELKRVGFHYSPINQAWQRMLNNGARQAAEYVIEKIGGGWENPAPRKEEPQ